MRGFCAVGLTNPKFESNCGGALRAAACFGASLVLYQGNRIKNQSTDTTKAWRTIPLIRVDDIMERVPHGCTPIAVEFTAWANSLVTFVHPERALYIFGPEDGSLPAKTMGRCKMTIKIPTIYCLNLAASVNVVLYDRIAKQMLMERNNRHL